MDFNFLFLISTTVFVVVFGCLGFFGLFWFWFFLPVRDHGKDVFYCYFLFSEPRVINVLLDRTSCPFQHNTLSFSSWKYRSRYLFQTFFKWVSNIREILPDLSSLFNVLGCFFSFSSFPSSALCLAILFPHFSCTNLVHWSSGLFPFSDKSRRFVQGGDGMNGSVHRRASLQFEVNWWEKGQSCSEGMNAPSTAGRQGGMERIRNSPDLCRNILRLGWSISESKAWQILGFSKGAVHR